MALITTNLPSGYHRDLQLLKEHLFPAFVELRDCIAMSVLMLSNISVRSNLLDDPKYQYLFSVEEVNKKVLQGVPFRDAYKQVGMNIEQGTYQYSTELNHTHEGSIGNLCNGEVKAAMDRVCAGFGFEKVEAAVNALIR